VARVVESCDLIGLRERPCEFGHGIFFSAMADEETIRCQIAKQAICGEDQLLLCRVICENVDILNDT
jgi:hypothetical protein